MSDAKGKCRSFDYGRPQRRATSAQDDIAKLEFVVSHPSGKDKDAARVGHPGRVRIVALPTSLGMTVSR